jgi:hypothetical protein
MAPVLITIDVIDNDSSAKVQQVAASLESLGPAGEAAGAQAGAGLDQISTHALSARENVRLLSEEMGVRVPRAMQSVMAQSAMLTGAIGMIAPAMIAIGGVDILVHLGEKLVDGYNKWVLMTDEIAAASDAVKLFGAMSAQAIEQQRAAQEHFIETTQGPKAADQFKANNVMNDPVDLSQIYDDDRWKKAPDEIKSDFQQIAGTSIAPMDLDITIARLQKYEEKQKDILATAKLVPENSGGAPGSVFPRPLI